MDIVHDILMTCYDISVYILLNTLLLHLLWHLMTTVLYYDIFTTY